MKKIKLSVGLLAFMGLAMLNYTQSESCIINNALASSDGESFSFSFSFSSSSSSSSSDEWYFASDHMLDPQSCEIKRYNPDSGKEYTVSGSKTVCTPASGVHCDQRMIVECHEI